MKLTSNSDLSVLSINALIEMRSDLEHQLDEDCSNSCGCENVPRFAELDAIECELKTRQNASEG